MLTFALKIFRPIIFFLFKKVSFPQSRKFSTNKEISHNYENFPQSRKFFPVKKIFAIKKIFHSQGNFLGTKNFFRIK